MKKRSFYWFLTVVIGVVLLFSMSGCSKGEEGATTQTATKAESGKSVQTKNLTLSIPDSFTEEKDEDGGITITDPKETYMITVSEQTFEEMSSGNFKEIVDFMSEDEAVSPLDNPYGNILGGETVVLLDEPKDEGTPPAVMIFVDSTGKKEGMDYLWIEIIAVKDDGALKDFYQKEEVVNILKSIQYQ